MSPTHTRLLVLEDDPVIAGIIAALASEVGMQARIAGNSHAFFDILADWTPTHVSVDLVMPGLDGVQILARLAQLECRARILIVSGVDARVLASAMRMAREHHLPVLGTLGKPFAHAELQALLAMPLTASPGRHEVPPLPGIGAESRREALERGEFLLHYQPKVDLRSGAVAGFEALARWQHPQHGILAPDWFIDAMEDDGSIVRLSSQVLEQALAWLGRVSGLIGPPPTVAINLSARDIAEPGLAGRLSDLSRQHRVDPKRVTIEITETNAMRDPRIALATVTSLRVLGFCVALDDFGTGYSSMAHLARLPLSSLKIDKSFVQAMASSPEAHKIVEAIIRLGGSLGLELVAEGVENEETAGQLREMGCHQIQGYLVAPALPEAAIAGWHSHWSRCASPAASAHRQSSLTNV
jgi:EAL domain-containing protein (putative c-di-GMP-specific phosphodiesterase class I)/CheY-like chemotaxis protein